MLRNNFIKVKTQNQINDSMYIKSNDTFPNLPRQELELFNANLPSALITKEKYYVCIAESRIDVQLPSHDDVSVRHSCTSAH